MSEKIAKYLTVVLGPHILLPVLFVITILKSGLNNQQLIIIFPSLLILQVIIPILYLVVAPRLGWIRGWEMKSKEERKPILILMLVLTAISLFIIHFFGNTLLFNLDIIFISLLIIFLGITNYWKISLHISLNTATAIFINFLFNWKLPILYLIIPIIFWVRLKLKRHTVKQLVAGILVTASITMLGLQLFGYL